MYIRYNKYVNIMAKKYSIYKKKLTLGGDIWKGVVMYDENVGLDVLSVKLSAWANHCDEFKNYQENSKNLLESFKKKLKKNEVFNETFDSNFIYTPHIKKVLVSPDYSFMVEFAFTVKNKSSISDPIKSVTELSNQLIGDINKSINFNFKKTKNG